MADEKSSGRPEKKKVSREQGQQAGDLEARRFALEEKLKRAGALGKTEKEAEKQDAPSGAAQALKLSSEFLAAVAVGIILGLGLDQLTGTSPWGLIIFVLLGFAAAVLNVLWSVGLATGSPVGKKGASRRK